MNQIPHDEWTEKIIARVNGELDAVENALFDNHVQTCPQCRRELREYELLSHRLHALERKVTAPALSPALLALKLEIAHGAQSRFFEELDQLLDEALLSETEVNSFKERPRSSKERVIVEKRRFHTITPNKKLKKARQVRFWTMKDAAKKIGVSLQTYSRWERGLQYPHVSTLSLICEAFKRTPEELGFEVDQS